MRILIDGIAGGIGSTLGYFLYKRGYKVFGVDNLSGGYKENLIINNEKYCKAFEVDIRNTEGLGHVLKVCKIDAIIHLAAITSLPQAEQNPQECFDVNTQGTLSVLEAARKAGIKVVAFASTSAVYENNLTYPFDENFPIQPTLAYPLSKHLSEQICITYREKYGMRIPILRYFNVFGARGNITRQSPPLVNYIVKEIIKGNAPTFHSDGNQKRDYVHVDCVCRATLAALINEKANSTYNVCSGKVLSVNEIYTIISNKLNFHKPATFNPPAKLWQNYDITINPDIIAKETNKFSLGYNYRLKDELGIEINTNLKELIENCAIETYNMFKDKIK